MSGNSAVQGAVRGDNVPELCPRINPPSDTACVTPSDYLSDYSPQDAIWDVTKALGDDLASRFNVDEFKRLAARLNACSNSVSLQYTRPDAHGETKLKLVGAMFCRVKLCPNCQRRRALKHKARFINRLPALLATLPAGVRWLFLTVTVENCDVTETRATIQAMNKAWAKLVKWKTWPALGWIKAIEVTEGQDNKAHPHFHCLLLVPASYFGKGYIKQDEWTAMWQKAAKLHYKPIIDVRAVKKDGVIDAAAEALKYSTKATDLLRVDTPWLHEYTRQIHGVRMIDTGGALRGLLADDYEDLINVDENEKVDVELDEDTATLVFGWNRGERRYRRKRTPPPTGGEG